MVNSYQKYLNGGFHSHGENPNSWLVWENPTKIAALGLLLFQETSISLYQKYGVVWLLLVYIVINSIIQQCL